MAKQLNSPKKYSPFNVRASSLPRGNHIQPRDHGRGWAIMHEVCILILCDSVSISSMYIIQFLVILPHIQLMQGLSDYRKLRGIKKPPQMYDIVARIASKKFRARASVCAMAQNHFRKNVALTFMAIKHSRMSMMEQMNEETQKVVPTVDQLVKRLKYTKNYLKLKKEVGDLRISEGLALMRAAGLELRNFEAGDSHHLAKVSRCARIRPHLRTLAEREYLLHWIESKLPEGGVIDNLFKRCDAPTKSAFVAGLKYRFFNHSTAMVYQNDEAHEFFILISGSVGVWVNKDLTIVRENIADFATKGTRVAVLPTGFSFGEASLKGDGAKRQASIIAEETCEVLIASSALFDAIIGQFNASSKATAIAALHGIWPFKGQRTDVLDKMGGCFDLVNVPPDMELYSQNKKTQNIYVLVEGECKELLYFQKAKAKKGEEQNPDGSTRQVLRIKDPSAVKELEPHGHSICNSSAIVVSQFSEQRLMGAFEVMKELPCLTTIVTVGACKALKAQVPAFLRNIKACPVLRQRIVERARLQKVFVAERKEQYHKVIQCPDADIRSLASFALNNRSYVHTPRALLNKNMRKKGISGSSGEENKSQHQIGDLYQTQHIENISTETAVRPIQQQSVMSFNFEKEKLRLDLKSVSNVNEQIEQYSARYKERLSERQRRKQVRQRWGRRSRRPDKRKRSPRKKYQPLCIGKMSESDKWLLEGFTIRGVKEQRKMLKGRLYEAWQDTSRSLRESDSRRSEFHDRVKYERKTRPHSARVVSKKRSKPKRKRKELHVSLPSVRPSTMEFHHFPPCTSLIPERPKTAPCVSVGQWCNL